jgi:hypothetical protein
MPSSPKFGDIRRGGGDLRPDGTWDGAYADRRMMFIAETDNGRATMVILADDGTFKVGHIAEWTISAWPAVEDE